ncbi:MAG: homocysteine S-methyltransferase family protein [Christensenellales bacterium]
MDLKQLIDNKIVLLDGAMGTILQRLGVKMEGGKPEMVNITEPQVIQKIHEDYLRAGSDVVYANTFGANRIKMAGYPYIECAKAGVKCARNAVKAVGKGLVALDMGSIGELVEPMGRVTFDEVYETYKEVVLAVADEVDLCVIETMSDLYETKAAVLAVKENCNKPLIVTMSFDEKGRTFAGCPVEAMVATMQGLGVDAVGLNCSLGPKQLVGVVDRLLSISELPVVVKPNAGMPTIRNGVTAFDMQASDWAEAMEVIVDKGVAIVGGCCGTDSEFIKILAEKIKDKKPSRPIAKHQVCVASGSKFVRLDCPKIVGERINPTGKKLMKQAIEAEDWGYIEGQAVEQAHAGADILDVNMGLAGIDEADMIVKAIKRVQSVVDLPIQIDSTDAVAIEKGLRYVSGKAIVNSVNGDDEVLDRVLPLVKKYGALVLGLTIDKDGIPKTVEKRLEIARKIVKRAQEYGISNEDVIIDTLTLTVGAEQEQAVNTLEAIRKVKEELGVKTALGVSNISFGLPERSLVNRTFLTMALTCGLDLAIINPNLQPMKESFLAYNLLAGIDRKGEKYIKEISTQTESVAVASGKDLTLQECIKQSLKTQAVETVKVMLAKGLNGLDIIDECVIPTLGDIGDGYEKGSIFLPQLISTAEVASAVCDVIKANIGSINVGTRAKMILATVEGDVHDIGKNIVKTVLQNYGYDIVDLGRDVAVERVVEAVKKNKPQILGLSALMTTTVKNMKRTIEEVRKVSDCLICVGGAVLSEEVAMQIGADAYSKDPRQLVKILESRGL